MQIKYKQIDRDHWLNWTDYFEAVFEDDGQLWRKMRDNLIPPWDMWRE